MAESMQAKDNPGGPLLDNQAVKGEGQVHQGHGQPGQGGRKRQRQKQKAADMTRQDKQQPGDTNKQDKGQPDQQKQCQPSGDNPPQKSKAQLKAERRAIQEAQRAAKIAKQQAEKGGEAGKKTGSAPSKKQEGASQSGGKKEIRVSTYLAADDEKATRRQQKRLEKQQIPTRTVVQKKVRLFKHLPQFEREVSLTKGLSFGAGGIHPVFLKLGLQYAEGVICGSNARCIALLGALKQIISEYSTPPQKELARDLESKIKPNISFLQQCRPLSVSMGSAIKYMKWHITHIPEDMSDTEAKCKLNDAINSFLLEKILLAGKAISQTYACTKVTDGDVIIVYAYSSLIKRVLSDAYDSGKKFRVIVVDSRPKLEGKEMLRRLVKHGIPCSYVLINAASYIMKEVTKVFLGAHALLANGYVMSRVGSSQIALLAKSFNVPVLVCCETYKFCERVQTDSFVFNELGDPDDLVAIGNKEAYLNDWRDIKSLSLLNLVYDVAPPELVSLVITEIGMIPCTSVPVVLRVKQVETEQES